MHGEQLFAVQKNSILFDAALNFPSTHTVGLQFR